MEFAPGKIGFGHSSESRSSHVESCLCSICWRGKVFMPTLDLILGVVA